MLELSPAALAMIVRVRELTEPGSELALRIAGGGSAPGLQMTLAAAPDRQDIVLVDPEATVFLDPVAADRLDGELLDARSDDRGSAFFLGTRSR